MPGTVQVGEPQDDRTRTIEAEHARALERCEQRPTGERLDCRLRADLDRDSALARAAGPAAGPEPIGDGPQGPEDAVDPTRDPLESTGDHR